MKSYFFNIEISKLIGIFSFFKICPDTEYEKKGQKSFQKNLKKQIVSGTKAM